MKASRPFPPTWALVCFACLAAACGSKEPDKGPDVKSSPAEKLYEDVNKNGGLAKKACEEAFSSCKLDGASKDEGKGEASLGFEAVFDAPTAAKLGFNEPKINVFVAIRKHASFEEARKAEKKSDADACFVAGSVLGKPYSVSISCGGPAERACCDKDFKGKLDIMVSSLAPLY